MAVNSITETLKTRRAALALAGILVLSFVLRMAFLHEPFERDEGWYAYIGQEILRGAIPYRDMIEMKPPGSFYLYALGISLFGATKEAVRVFTASYSVLTVLAVFGTARLVHGVRAGLFAALLCAVYLSAPTIQASSSNTEVFMVLPVMASIYFFLKSAESGRRLFLAASGFAAGCAMLIKTVALPYAVLLFIFCLFIRRPAKSSRDYLLDILSLVGPPLALAGMTFAYFAYHGALADLIYWTVTFARKYRDIMISGPQLLWVIKLLAPELALMTLVAIPTALWLAVARRGLASLLLVGLILAALAAVLLPGKNFPHYFIQLIPPLAVMAGIGLAEVSRRKGLLLYLTVPVVAGLFAYSVKEDYKFYLVYSPQLVSMAKYGPTFADSETVAAYLKERTEPTDYIFQWGFEPELYFLANRRAPVPYISSTLVPYAPDPAAAVRQIMARLGQTKPKYFIVQPEWSDIPGLPEFPQVALRDYYLENIVRYAYIYRRRPGT
ncbi:MAG TPA: glycosyltransferase family 39 protein [Geobacteraceae bacterium]